MEKENFGVELCMELGQVLVLYCSYFSNLYQKAIAAVSYVT